MEDNLSAENYGFIHFLSDGILLYRQDSIIAMNHKAAALLGEPRDCYVNKPLQEFMERLDKRDEDIRKNNKEKAADFDTTYRCQQGGSAALNLTITEVSSDIGMLIIKNSKSTKFPHLNALIREDCCKMNPYVDVCGKWYKYLIDSMPLALMVTKEEGCVYANSAAALMLEAEDEDELLEKSISEYFQGGMEGTQTNAMKYRETSFVITESKAVTEKDRVIDVEMMSSVFLYRGEKMKISIIKDITERKKLEAEKKLLQETIEYDQLKTEFFSNLSHELKTPLNILLGTLQLITAMHDGFAPCSHYQKFKYYFQIMRQNSYRLLRLINNLIDISRIDSGFLEMRFINGDIVKLLEDIVISVDAYAKMKGLELVLEKQLEKQVMAIDYDKIERIILNLISNAIKFNRPEGKIKITVSRQGDVLQIIVADTGIGIPPDMTDKIFERFRQVDNLFTRKTEGSGIGLSLVKSLVEGHGGTIAVSSELEKGSEFTVCLPIKNVQNEQVLTRSSFVKQDKVERIHIEFSDIYSVS